MDARIFKKLDTGTLSDALGVEDKGVGRFSNDSQAFDWQDKDRFSGWGTE